MSYWSTSFWKASAERAIKTAAQSAVLAIGAGVMEGTHLDDLLHSPRVTVVVEAVED